MSKRRARMSVKHRLPQSAIQYKRVTMSFVNVIELTEDEVPGAKFTSRRIEDHSNEKLKRWLVCRGLKSSGKRAELIERCRNCITSGKQDEIYIGVDHGKWYEKKLAENNSVVGQRPMTVPVVGWKPFTADLLPPLFNYGHAYHWIVETVPSLPCGNSDSDDEENDVSCATDKSLRRGQLYVRSGNVGEVSAKYSSNVIYYKAKVLASMRADIYTVTVTLSIISGAVTDASCHCKASALSRCSHVAALLLFLNDCVSKSDEPACTDLPCQWNRGKKRKDPSSINEAVYSFGRNTQINVIKFDPRPPGSSVSSQSVNNFIQDLQLANTNGEISMWQTVFTLNYEDYTLDSVELTLLKSRVLTLLDNLKPAGDGTSSMIADTLDQSCSPVWHSNRYIRITASNAKDGVQLWHAITECGLTTGVLHRLSRFLRKNVWGLDRVMTKDMSIGIEKEGEARDGYAAFKQSSIPGFTVAKSGLWVSTSSPQLACSPDGLVTDPSAADPLGLVEIKVLKMLQIHSPADIVTKVKNAEMIKELGHQCFEVTGAGDFVLKQNHKYYSQIQFQIGVTGRKWCDFVLWSAKGSPVIQRIDRDEKYIKEMFVVNKKLWEAAVAVEVIEMRTPRNLKPIVLL